jgi:crossover junction endodeoxyribonuclease RuvC
MLDGGSGPCHDARVIVLGIDPGSRRCGFGVVARRGARLELVEAGVLVPGERPVAERLARILDGLDEVIARAGPAEVSVEQVFAGASPRSALVLGQARGVALAAAARAGLPVYEYAPSEVKLAFTGSGRASKDQMLRTARMLLGATPALSDEADAIALAVCHLARRAARLALAADGAAPAAALARLRPARRDHRGLP